MGQTIMKVYKVTDVDKYSACGRDVNYGHGKTYAPAGTRLFCFDTLEHAKEFVLELQQGCAIKNKRVWIANATGVSKPKLCALMCDHIEQFWANWSHRTLSSWGYYAMRVPIGTLWAKTITLIEEIK